MLYVPEDFARQKDCYIVGFNFAGFLYVVTKTIPKDVGLSRIQAML